MDKTDHRIGFSGPLTTNELNRLTDVELLATYFSSIQDKAAAIALAHRLLNYFGNLRSMLNSSLQTFQHVSGINSLFYLQMQAVREMCHRSNWISLKEKTLLNQSGQVHSFLKRKLRDNRSETFATLFLDAQNHFLAYEELCQGTINRAVLHPRILIERLLHHNASALILAHNHPSGQVTPSKEDITLTKQLHKILKLIDVNLLDHLIIGDNEIYSIMHDYKKFCY